MLSLGLEPKALNIKKAGNDGATEHFKEVSQLPVDPASVANVRDIWVSHFHLDLDVDFDVREVAGIVTLSFVRREPGVTEILLDVHDLDVHSVLLQDGSEETALLYEITKVTSFGSKLAIQLPTVSTTSGPGPKSPRPEISNGPSMKRAQTMQTMGGKSGIRPSFRRSRSMQLIQAAKERLVVEFTASRGRALCWLGPEQTAGRDHPYMFTQGQSILNRCFFPCQDTPAVRATYSAAVTVPAPLTAVMSATMLSPIDGEPLLGHPICAHRNTNRDRPRRLYRFEMMQSVSVYLVALAVGNIRRAHIGPRSDVWAEPCMLEVARKEFEGITEQYLTVGERLFGPYMWERYDLLVMPPSFPFGGMENPRLTFLSPTLVVGDRSLCATVAHEICHSWFGNLVTNASWGDFFLNEGFTMYAQRRVIAEVHGAPYAALEAVTGWQELQEEMDELGRNSPLTRLRVPLEEGLDPEETYNSVAYEKGYSLVCYLCSLAPSPQEFDEWLRQYALDFRFRCIAAEAMFDHFLNHFPVVRDTGAHEQRGLDFQSWLHTPGDMLFTPDYSQAAHLVAPAEELAGRWRQHGSSRGRASLSDAAFEGEDIRGWPADQVCHFLDTFTRKEFSAMQPAMLEEMAILYDIKHSMNPEIQYRWCKLVVHYGVDSCASCVANFLRSQAKLRFTVPLYKEMMRRQDDTFRTLAEDMFQQTSPGLHPELREIVGKIVGYRAPLF